MSLGILDAFDDMPEELNATFDIVHVRALAVIVKGGDPGPLIKNLLKMLSRLHEDRPLFNKF